MVKPPRAFLLPDYKRERAAWRDFILLFLESGIVGRHTLRLHEGNSDRPFERAMLMLRTVTILCVANC